MQWWAHTIERGDTHQMPHKSPHRAESSLRWPNVESDAKRNVLVFLPSLSLPSPTPHAPPATIDQPIASCVAGHCSTRPPSQRNEAKQQPAWSNEKRTMTHPFFEQSMLHAPVPPPYVSPRYPRRPKRPGRPPPHCPPRPLRALHRPPLPCRCPGWPSTARLRSLRLTHVRRHGWDSAARRAP